MYLAIVSFSQYSFITVHYKVLEQHQSTYLESWLIRFWLKLGFIIFNSFNMHGQEIIFKILKNIALVIYCYIKFNIRLRGLKKHLSSQKFPKLRKLVRRPGSSGLVSLKRLINLWVEAAVISRMNWRRIHFCTHVKWGFMSSLVLGRSYP